MPEYGTIDFRFLRQPAACSNICRAATLLMRIPVSDRALLVSSVICALAPPVSLATAPIPTPGPKEAIFLFIFGALIPTIWLALTIAYYRRVRTKNARWLLALAPIAFIYLLGALVLGIGVVIKPGRW